VPDGKRLGLLTFLEDSHIQTRVTFSGNITRHPVYRQYLAEYPNADRIMSDAFLPGCQHGMSLEDVDYVCAQIRRFLACEQEAGAKATAQQP
jgi:dTDP-4-amino-4,6-dideoxygalactose transaminase